MKHHSNSMSQSSSYSAPSPGSRRFIGTLRELQDLILLTGDYGEWQEKPNGVWRYSSEDGGGLNWSSTKGTLWIDGPPLAKERLRVLVEAAFKSEPTKHLVHAECPMKRDPEKQAQSITDYYQLLD
jgi:hypothetical protein